MGTVGEPMSSMAQMFMIGGAMARHLLLDRDDIYSGYLNLLFPHAWWVCLQGV